MYETTILVLENKIEHIDIDLKYSEKQIKYLKKQIKFESIPKYLENARNKLKDMNNKIEKLKIIKFTIIHEIKELKQLQNKQNVKVNQMKDITENTKITYSGESSTKFKCLCGRIIKFKTGELKKCKCGIEYGMGVRVYKLN